MLRESGGGKTTLLGDVAHIVARREDGPRGERDWTDEQLNAFDNLLLLCPEHHRMVDDRPDLYPAELLGSWKARHEAWIQSCLASAMPAVGYVELHAVTQTLLDSPAGTVTDFDLTEITEKMRRNGISDGAPIQLGLCKAKEVEAFIQDRLLTEPAFADKLLCGLAAEYDHHFERGLRGDHLLDALRDFACQGRHDFKYQAASLAVVVYFFEKCDLFEK